MSSFRSYFTRVLGVTLALAFMAGKAGAEALVANVADTRTTLAFSVSEAAAQDWLPAPWKTAPLPKGPFKGANLLLVCIDRLLHQDADGKPKAGGSYRMVVLVVPAMNPETGDKAPFITRVYSPQGAPGPYKNSLEATVSRTSSSEGTAANAGTGSDSWTVGQSGGTMELRVEYEKAVPKRLQREMRPRSAVDPTLLRIYRYEQLIDVVKSIPAGTDRAPSHYVRVSIPELAALFDGNEQLVGIAVIPWYSRQTFLP